MHPANECCTYGEPGGHLNWARRAEYVGDAHEKNCQTFSANAKKPILPLRLVMSRCVMTFNQSSMQVSQPGCVGRSGKPQIFCSPPKCKFLPNVAPC